jgi:hypothetical protein
LPPTLEEPFGRQPSHTLALWLIFDFLQAEEGLKAGVDALDEALAVG